jgi:arsenate reductase
MKARILILCTGNSCRSQMAEGLLKSLDGGLEVFSAGTKPEKRINPNAVEVMSEIGIDISSQYPKDVGKFTGDSFDYVITVCDNAKEICPVFTGIVKNRLHIGFDDPADAAGSKEEVLKVYRRVRDEIREAFTGFYSKLASNINL